MKTNESNLARVFRTSCMNLKIFVKKRSKN